MKLIFKGVVQGVGFRPTVYRLANELNLKGYVLNRGSEVEVVIDHDTDRFISLLKERLTPPAMITDIIKEPYDPAYDDFRILHSEDGERGSVIPVDICTCDDCLKEIFDPDNRRYLYPFTNCTVCGARFSLINNVPYDREHTAMNKFPLCSKCKDEYNDPTNRRYHAQTISCPDCGPRTLLYNKDKKMLSEGEEAIERFAQYIDQGCIGVIKSWGGMHICCITDEIKRFREWYKRPQKPFAIMVKDIETAEKYAYINTHERGLLTSKSRPIILLKKKKDKNDLISPGLDTVGIFLPYTGVQHILFSFLQNHALVMTSANIPGEPMITSNDEAFNLKADYYLLHEQDIPNRIDDSVIKLYNNDIFFIRKSRGFIPERFTVPYTHHIISVGAGENIQAALSCNNHLYTTQYIGDSSYYPTLVFLENGLKHLMNLTMDKSYLDAVSMDLHPGYESRIIARHFAEEYNTKCYEIQHHWAHAASLLLDNNIDEAVVLTLDGLGYGDDNHLWGGEALLANLESYKRIGHLEYIPLIGGDLATKDPRRLVFAIFDRIGKEKMFSGKEADILRKIKSKSPLSSSMGRILDALSCYLDICYSTTYDGEPAMKLERYLAIGEYKHDLELKTHGNIIYTCDLFNQLDEKTNKKRLTEKEKANIAYSFVYTVLRGLTDIAIDTAFKKSLKYIGITGGVSYNIPIVKMVKKMVDESGLHLLVHRRIPNGDGGVAIGQNVILGSMLN
ncbi:MAG: carbamoyltransferase HypF [Candidatus Thermoplasmatota archaeon]